jgi:hydrogenase maturation factor
MRKLTRLAVGAAAAIAAVSTAQTQSNGIAIGQSIALSGGIAEHGKAVARGAPPRTRGC